MRKLVRVGIILVVVVLLLVGAGAVAVRGYLGSDAARQQAAGQLSELLGGTVDVTRIDAGLGSTSLAVVVPGGAGAEPLLTGTLVADVSPVGLAAGRQPSEVTVENARVTLRLDRDGNPVDPLPQPGGAGGGSFPAVRVTNAELTIDQAGRPPFRVAGIDLRLAEANGRLTATGEANDPVWGQWQLTADAAPDGSAGTAKLTAADPVHVTQPMLRSIPGVAPSAWEAVNLEGDTTGTVAVTKAGGDWTYRVVLAPRQTRVGIPSIDLTVSDMAGTIVVEGEKVTLSGLTGTAADGRLAVDSVMDFAPSPSVLTFDVKADGLDVRKLPPAWKLPPTLSGRVKGKADVTLRVSGDDVDYQGTGRGEVVGAKLGDIPIEYFGLKLVGGKKGLEFQSEMPASHAPPAAPGPRLAAALLAVLLQAPADPPAAKKPGEPTYFQANLRLRDVDLAELLAKLEVKLPIRVAGKVSVQVSAGIPLDNARELRAYRLDGSVTLPSLVLQDLTLHDVAAKVNLREGVLTLTELSGTVPPPTAGGTPGSFRGTARYGLDPQTDLTADLKLTDLPLGQVFKAAPALAGTAAGPVTGGLTLRIPGNRLDDVTAIVADGSLASPALTVLQRRAESVRLDLSVRNGVAKLTRAEATVEKLPLTGSASLGLTAPYRYEAAVRTGAADVVALQELAPEAALPFPVRGTIDARAEAAGTVRPFAVAAKGSASAAGLTLGSAEVRKLAFDWAADAEQVSVNKLTAEVYGGTVTGSARVPVAAGAKPGAFDLKLADVDSAAVTRGVPSLPVKLEGKVSGTVAGTVPPPEAGKERQPSVALDLTAPRLRIQGIPSERLRGRVGYKPGAITYDLTGDALGGEFGVEGTYPLAGGAKTDPPPAAPPAPAPDGGPGAGTFRLNGIDLSRLGDALRLPALTPLRGILDLTFRYRLDGPDGLPTGTGRLAVIDLGWGTGPGSDVAADVRAFDGVVELSGLSGRVAGGDLRGRVRYNLNNPARSFFTLTLDRADAGDLLAPLGVSGFGGTVSVTVRGRIGATLSGSGTVTAARTKLGPTPVSELRMPFDWAFAPGGMAELTVRDAYAQAAGGRITGSASVRYGRAAEVTGGLRFVDVDVSELLGSVGRGGRANGRFDFSGREVRSVNDLTGLLTASFGGGGGGFADSPLLRALTPYLSPSSSFTQARSGDLRARLNRGLFRVQRFTLTSPNTTLWAEGTVGLDGRLNLDVTAQTGQVGPNARLLRLLRLVPVAGPIPLGLLLDINDFLSNRTVALTVTGTVDRPIVRANLARLLADEAIRFLLSRYLPVGATP